MCYILFILPCFSSFIMNVMMKIRRINFFKIAECWFLDLFKVLLMCLIQFSLESKIESYNIHCKFAFIFYVIHGYFDWGALFCETDITQFLTC